MFFTTYIHTYNLQKEPKRLRNSFYEVIN